MATVEKMQMLKEGYEKLNADLRRLKAERPEIVDAIEEARAHGDLSENAEYHAAKEAQSHNEGRIMELESLIGRADIIDVSKLGGDTIKFGATVQLIDDDTEEEKRYQIVGEPEADVRSGKVSQMPSEWLLPKRRWPPHSTVPDTTLLITTPLPWRGTAA